MIDETFIMKQPNPLNLSLEETKILLYQVEDEQMQLDAWIYAAKPSEARHIGRAIAIHSRLMYDVQKLRALYIQLLNTKGTKKS